MPEPIRSDPFTSTMSAQTTLADTPRATTTQELP